MISIHLPQCRTVQQNLTVALPTLRCSNSVCQRPRVQTIGGPDDIWLPAPLEYWLQCLSARYSSKLMMQATACCLQLSARVERSWQERLLLCEPHAVESLGACSLRADDYSLRYGSGYFWVHCTTSCAAFLPVFLLPALRQEQRKTPFVCVGCHIK